MTIADYRWLFSPKKPL